MLFLTINRIKFKSKKDYVFVILRKFRQKTIVKSLKLRYDKTK